ncbi:MAG: hypothetical protein AAF447_12845, partial [Myxococcota bacterium]
LASAAERAPDEAQLQLALALWARRAGQPQRALAALEAFVALGPDPAAKAWAEAVRPRFAARAAFAERAREDTRSGIVLRHRLDPGPARLLHLGVLTALDEAAALLGTARRPSLVAVVYDSARAFAQAVCAPSWSGALFDGVLHFPPRAAGAPATVRHEAAHAQLAFAAPRAPVWLHEGFAQRLEGERRRNAARDASFALMRRERTYVPFPSLEGSFLVIDDAAAARLAYHQSAAMVMALEARDPRALALGAAHLREGGDPREVLAAMGGLDGDALLAHLDAWEGR